MKKKSKFEQVARQTHQIETFRVFHDLTAQHYIQSAPVSFSSEPFYGRTHGSISLADDSSSRNGGKDAETEAATTNDRCHFIGARTMFLDFII